MGLKYDAVEWRLFIDSSNKSLKAILLHNGNSFSSILTGHSVQMKNCPASWGCRIHRLHLCRGVRSPNECPGYDTKWSDGEVPVMLEIWGMRNTPLLLSLPGSLWPRVVAPDRVLSMGQIVLNYILMLNWIVWNRTIFVCQTELFEMELFVTLKPYLY